MRLAHLAAPLIALPSVLSTSTPKPETIRQVSVLHWPESRDGQNFFLRMQHQVARVGDGDSRKEQDVRQSLNELLGSLVRGWNPRLQRPIVEDIRGALDTSRNIEQDPFFRQDGVARLASDEQWRIVQDRRFPALRQAWLKEIRSRNKITPRQELELHAMEQEQAQKQAQQVGRRPQAPNEDREPEPNAFHIPLKTIRGQHLRLRRPTHNLS